MKKMRNIPLFRAVSWLYATVLVFSVQSGCGQPDYTGERLLPQTRESLRDGQVKRIDTNYCAVSTPMIDALIHLRQAAVGKAPYCDEVLSQLAWSQRHWMTENRVLLSTIPAHQQIPGTPKFSGATLKDRIKAVGLSEHSFYIAESIIDGARSEAIWENHLASVFHRGILLSPGLESYGLAYLPNETPTVFTASIFDGDSVNDATYFPRQGSVVGVNRYFGERPTDPLIRMGAGFPVSVHFPWSCASEKDLQVSSFQLAAADGAVVPARIYTHGSLDGLRPSEAFLIPEHPLINDSIYSAAADLICGEYRFNRRWSFRTR